ncbi:class I SAM-dependent methyltransferase [Halobacillus halophilus]|nr:class I SAM-dependent methyltransferase [Halobacillus halophilus]
MAAVFFDSFYLSGWIKIQYYRFYHLESTLITNQKEGGGMSEEMKKRVQSTFSKNKEAYVSSATHNNQQDLNLITEWLNPEPNWKGLDLATGGGHVAREMSRWMDHVVASDLTKDMLQNTARHLSDIKNLSYIVADVSSLPFLDESFDVVCCRIAPHHFSDPEKFIKEAYRVLKPRGLFLMIDNTAPEDDHLDLFYNTFEEMRDPSHHRAWKVSEWKTMIQPAGFQLKREMKRKKTLPFRDWLERTLHDKNSQQLVEEYFLKAGPQASSYFSFVLKEGSMESFSIDEWMVLCQKHDTH